MCAGKAYDKAGSASISLSIYMYRCVSATLLVQDDGETEDGEDVNCTVGVVREQKGSKQHVSAAHSLVNKGYIVCLRCT